MVSPVRAAHGSTIRTRGTEFSAITDNMREGMIILSSNGTIMSINASAMRLFGGNQSVVGKSIFVLERSPEFTKALEQAGTAGRSEFFFERNGFINRLIASAIQDKGRNIGTCILIVDETEKVMAEGMRKEFSANVSHELKTPLHSILASSELLMNNLVKEADKMSFIERIHNEAEHLVTLIEDIIRLSQLDETKDFPVEPVNVAQITGSVLESLEKSAGEKHVTVVNEVDDITISGVQRLVYEIVYNLCDNAIRYNREGGSVTVRCKAEGDKAVLSVSDTGIGIPAEHRARIFERFYRVDTSHSRSTGGTGLGLSIVKHACQVLRAQIELESEEGKGSVFTIIFNK